MIQRGPLCLIPLVYERHRCSLGFDGERHIDMPLMQYVVRSCVASPSALIHLEDEHKYSKEAVIDGYADELTATILQNAFMEASVVNR